MNHLGDIGVADMIILKVDIKGTAYNDVDWVHLAQDTSCYEDSNESSGSIKAGEFLEQLSVY
jgi:hypothetical protein